MPATELDLELTSLHDDQVATEQQDDPLDLLCQSLSDQLGAFGYQWLCACAVFPVLQLALTVHLGQALASAADRPRPSEQELLAICRLPWFRKGWIPDELRLRLARDIEAPFHTAVREVISRFVFSAIESSSQTHDHLSSARLPNPPRNWPVVLDAWMEVGTEDTGPDVILLSFMKRRLVNPVRLRMIAPGRTIWSRLLDLLDPRTLAYIVAALALSGSLWFSADEISSFWRARTASSITPRKNLESSILDPQPKQFGICRDPSHGVESYKEIAKISRSSGWMGGGHSQPEWCNDLIGQLRREYPADTQFKILGSNERSESRCAPFNCPQHDYTCDISVNEPVYVLKASPACPLSRD